MDDGGIRTNFLSYCNSFVNCDEVGAVAQVVVYCGSLIILAEVSLALLETCA